MIVKICGLTTLADALAAVECGADLLGFNFYPRSPRFIRPQDCARIVEMLAGSGVVSVGVLVDSPVTEVRAVLDACGLDLAQLSGDEPPGALEELGERAFKALRPANPADLAAALTRYPRRVTAPAWLVDAYRPGEYGGTGLPADWSLAAGLAARAPLLLAGGLRPENVAGAIRTVRPWGVDVASGVEREPGRKDAALMRRFILAAKSIETEEQIHR